MGEFDSAEILELIGLYILHQMKDIFPKNNLGLYWDDGLAVTDLPGPDLERLIQQESVRKQWSTGHNGSRYANH